MALERSCMGVPKMPGEDATLLCSASARSVSPAVASVAKRLGPTRSETRRLTYAGQYPLAPRARRQSVVFDAALEAEVSLALGRSFHCFLDRDSSHGDAFHACVTFLQSELQYMSKKTHVHAFNCSTVVALKHSGIRMSPFLHWTCKDGRGSLGGLLLSP